MFHSQATQHRNLFRNFIDNSEVDQIDPSHLISELRDLENENIDDLMDTISELFQDLENRGINIEGQSFKKPSSFRIHK